MKRSKGLKKTEKKHQISFFSYSFSLKEDLIRPYDLGWDLTVLKKALSHYTVYSIRVCMHILFCHPLNES